MSSMLFDISSFYLNSRYCKERKERMYAETRKLSCSRSERPRRKWRGTDKTSRRNGLTLFDESHAWTTVCCYTASRHRLASSILLRGFSLCNVFFRSDLWNKLCSERKCNRVYRNFRIAYSNTKFVSWSIVFVLWISSNVKLLFYSSVYYNCNIR